VTALFSKARLVLTFSGWVTDFLSCLSVMAAFPEQFFTVAIGSRFVSSISGIVTPDSLDQSGRCDRPTDLVSRHTDNDGIIRAIPCSTNHLRR
jgi:hypothetical protein